MENNSFPKFNEFQTQLTQDLIDSFPKEVIDDFWDYVNNVPFIQRLISPDRKRAKDLPKDEDGKIIVDLSNPHILEDMDYFREAAIHYQQHKCYTKLRVNSHPQSEFMKWFKREIWRCWYGMVREYDGEWIPGLMYFYLNYMPIIQTVIKRNKKGKRYGERRVDLPEVWEGVYWRFHYIDQARYGGLYNNFQGGLHGTEIASRGKSKSYAMASILANYFILGLNEDHTDKVKSLIVADNKEFLTKDGTLTKYRDCLEFLYKNTQFPSRELKTSLSDMHWISGDIDNEGNPVGSQNETLGVSIGDDPDKSRGKRPHPLYCKVLTPKGMSTWGDIQIGDHIYGDDGKLTKVIDIPFEGEDDIYKITLKDNRVTYAGKDHLFKVDSYFEKTASGGKFTRIMSVADIKNFIENNPKKVVSIPKNEGADFSKYPTLIDPYVLGLYLGDGCYSNSRNTYLDITMLPEDMTSIIDKIPYRVELSKNRDITHRIHLIESDKELQNMSRAILTYYNLNERNSTDKFIPKEFLYNSRENRYKLLQGLMDSDGSVTTQGTLEYSTKSKQLKDDFMFLVRSLGINCSMYLKTMFRDDNIYYRIKLHTENNKIFNIPRKRDRVRTKRTGYGESFSMRTSIKNIEYVGKQPCKCVTVDNDSHLYLIDDFITTHNSDFMGAEEFGSFNKFMEWWSTSMPNVQEGEIAFGFAFNIGTGGTEGSNFMGALAMINEPESKFIYGLPNVYDKGSSGKKKTVFFYPAFVNYKPYYNSDGVSDVVGAMLSELKQRYIIKYNSTDPLELTRRRAEFAFTLKDAIMRRDSTIYPVADLNDQINYLDANPSELQSMYIGRLDISDGEVKWVPDNSLTPIMNFPHKDNKQKGCVYIKTHPVKDSNGQVPWGRYISGADTIDTDGAETLSLFSGYILDLWTDDIVAEYTGREDLTDDSFEIYRRLLLYYNAEGNYESNKKGLFSHFSKYNSLHLLSDVLEFLKEKNPQKVTYGNSSKGTVSTAGVKNMGKLMIRNYLLKPYVSTRIETIDGQKEEIESTVPNLRRIKFRALLQELSQHNLDGNFDRHDALLQLMLLREDKLRLLGDDSFENRYNNIEKDYLGNDSFFTDNYHSDKEDDFKEQFRKIGYEIQ